MRVQIDQGWHDFACYSRPPAAKISHKRISDSSSRNAARLLTQGVPFSCLICKQMLTYVCVSVCVISFIVIVFVFVSSCFMPSCFCLIYGRPMLMLGGILPLAACHLFESQTVPGCCISLYHHCILC